MNELTYVITKFDETTKTIDVSFGDNSWARLNLKNPLPKNKEELDFLIKDFAEPIEAIQARQAPDADLSYISAMVNQTQTTARKSVAIPEVPEIDPEVLANSEMWEQTQFKKQIGDVLVEFGLLSSNPMSIPVSNS